MRNQSDPPIVRTEAPFRVALFVVPGFSMMALSAAVEPLRSVNRLLGEQRYEWSLVGREAGPVAASNGFDLAAAHGIADAPEADVTVVVASLEVEHYRDRAVFAWLRRLAARRRRLGAISNGAIVLARAGLLAGRRVTVHWESREAFAEEFPEIDLSSDLYCLERDVMSAAGGLASMDMMLALIASRDGRDVAADVSEQFLRGPARPPTAMQRQDVRWRYRITDRRLATAVRTMENRMAPVLRAAEVADAAGISERQLERLFATKFGVSPGRFYLDLRLKAAKDWLLNSTDGLETIAARTGFSSVPHFSRSFKAWSGQSPSSFRRSG